MMRANEFPLEREILITVKAYPNPSNKYQETVCIAGVTKKEGWTRLYPISFRHLPQNLQFKKYQLLRLRMRKHESDSRPESYRPDQQSFQLGRFISAWAKMRQKWVDELWGKAKDSYLFVGNQRVHPRSFLILGVFWPPKLKDTNQMKLL